MKFLILAALVGVATAGLVQPGPGGPIPAPNPEDAFEPIAIGPAVIDSFEPVDGFEPIAIGPAIVEPEPIAIGPVVVDKPVVPSAASPLVQIIVNVNAAAVIDSTPGSAPVRPEPVPTIPILEEIVPEPVHVVEEAPEPVQVVEVAPVPAEPVQIGIPVLPEPAVILPEQLN
ncbi:hypothetical protein PYW08_005765 [Mythimna loreyi]|uniref:Uncharacterized protein n=1 Tax=Mythimna loreyi TaxID=667449 RepID=A0ACC2QJJ7_9NEOP|nr:hypothetical protein PYW08_005765 [Mythimna loreyi]